MSEHKPVQVVAAPGHEEYVKELLETVEADIEIVDSGEPSPLDWLIDAGIAQRFSTPQMIKRSNLAPHRMPALKNNEAWRGKGKRLMPRGKYK